MNAGKYAINIDASPKFHDNQHTHLLLIAFPVGDELTALPISQDGEWCRPSTVFNPYQAFKRYYRLRESVEKETCITAGAKLTFAVLEYWLRYQVNRSRLSPTLLGEKLGVTRVQAHYYIEELLERCFIRLNRDQSFAITDSKGKNRDPKSWKEYGSIIPAPIASFKGIEMLDKIVYGHLVRSAGRTGKIWKSQASVALSMGLDSRRILHSIERLERERLILTLHPGERVGWGGVNQKNKKAGARGAKNLYAFLGHRALANQQEQPL